VPAVAASPNYSTPSTLLVLRRFERERATIPGDDVEHADRNVRRLQHLVENRWR
jgi:hypothetical protein